MLRTTLFFLLTALVLPCSAAPAALKGKLKLTLEQQVIPAYQQGDSIAVVRTLAPLVSRLTDDVLAEVDAFLQQQQVPPLGELLATARTSLIRQQVSGLPRPTQRELLIVLPVWHTELAAVLDSENQPGAITNPPPRGTSMEDYEKLFWELHVAENQLWNARQLAGQIANWTRRGLNRSNLNDAQRTLLDFDYETGEARIRELAQQRMDRELLLRAQRLGDAVNDLADRKDHRSRLLAAFALATDSRLLAEYLERHPKLPDGDDPSTMPLTKAELAELTRQGRQAAGEKLLVKGQLLFEGLHWWLRGRYGRGSEGGGLFKNKQVLTNPALRFGLLMPTDPPRPTVPGVASRYEPVPFADRRHHYVWAWENQGIELRQFKSSVRVTSREFY
jgi:hypothetical protein